MKRNTPASPPTPQAVDPRQLVELWNAATQLIQDCLGELATAFPARKKPRRTKSKTDTPGSDDTQSDAAARLKILLERLKAASVAITCLKQIQDAQRKSLQETNHDDDADDDRPDDADPSDLARRVDEVVRSIRRARGLPENPEGNEGSVQS